MSLTRAELLRRGLAGAGLLTIPGLLAACGGEVAVPTAPSDVLRFSNWPYYIDFDEETKRRPTLELFTEKTGIRVEYREEINDNATFFAKIAGPLQQRRGVDRDIIVLTDNSRFPSLMIKKEWLLELVKERIPNLVNLIDAQKSPPFDPTRTYSLPWQSGMTGIAWNEEVTGPVTSLTQLLEDPELKGRVTLLSDMADTVGLAMLANGDDPRQVTDATFEAAVGDVRKAVDSGQVRRFTGNDFAQPLTRGDLAASVAWSGDTVQLLADNPKLRWAVPDDGGMIWTDNMLVPIGGNPHTASIYMNFVYDPVIAAKIAAYINYVPPVKGVREELAKTDPETADNPLIFPTDDMLAKLHQYDPASLNNREHISTWQQVLGA